MSLSYAKTWIVTAITFLPPFVLIGAPEVEVFLPLYVTVILYQRCLSMSILK
jgi:hypothetical protein